MRQALAVILLAATLGLPVRSSSAQDDPVVAADAERTENLRQAYLKNRDKFRSFKCQFRLMQGTCETLDDALQGKMDVVSPMTGIWCIDGEKQRLELITERVGESPIPEIVAEPGRKFGFAAVRFRDTEKSLVDGAVGIHYSPSLGADIGEQIKAVSSPKELPLPWPDFVDTPIGIGLMAQNERWSPGADLAYFTRPERVRRLSESADSTAGRPCEVLTVARKWDTATTMHYRWFLDLKRGYAPVEARFVNVGTGEILNQAIVTDIRELANGGYFPFRSVVIERPRAMRPHSVSIFEVSEVSLERPTSDDLSIILPAGAVLRPLNGFSSVKLDKRTKIAADALASWRDHLDNPEAYPRPVDDSAFSHATDEGTD